jgi:hypothetical protein
MGCIQVPLGLHRLHGQDLLAFAQRLLTQGKVFFDLFLGMA